MKRLTAFAGVLSLSGLLLIALGSCAMPWVQLDPSAPEQGALESAAPQWVAGELLVGYETEADLAHIASEVQGLVKFTLPAIRVALLELSDGDVAGAVAALNQRATGLRFAEPNYVRERIDPEPSDGRFVEPSQAVEGAARPSQAPGGGDPLRMRQWALDLMQAESAWQIATGRGTVIGIVDTGVDGTHPDLRGKQVGGYDCLTGEAVAPDTDSTQEAFTHGTHVAGIAAASGDNGEGIVGVAPDAKLMILPIFNLERVGRGNSSGYVGDANVARCILWAALVGADGAQNSGDEADVLNNSWGGRGYGQTLKEAIDKVVEAGVVFVNSMGNSSEDEVLYPKGYPGVLGVGATDPKDQKVDFSTMGSLISVGAPGQDILSSVPLWLTRPTDDSYGYQYFSGTSMAAPQASGAIALLKERFPDATAYQLQKVLEQTADDVETPGFDRRTGWGRINLLRALQTTQLPADGAVVLVKVVTRNADESGQQHGVPFVDVILRQNGLDRYFAQTNSQGQARFPDVEPGGYQVLAAGADAVVYSFRSANRISQRAQVLAASGETSEVTVAFNTTLDVSVEWSESEDVDLLVGEPGPDGTVKWVGVNGTARWGVFAVDDLAPGATGGIEAYSLLEEHYPYAVYPLAISAERAGGPVQVTVTLEQNGVTERFGPFLVESGEVLYSYQWPGWWESEQKPEQGFTSEGPGGPWVY